MADVSCRSGPCRVDDGIDRQRFVCWNDARQGAVARRAAIEPGQWELREEGRAGATRQVCINDPDMLVQFQHGPMHCSRFVVDDQPMSATVTYDCQGNGRGRTTIRASTPRALYLETQGIARGAPFDMRFEGRRTGACAASAR